MQRITYFERQIIQSGLRVDKSVRAIAKSLGRDHKAILYEIKSHSGFPAREYCAEIAQRIANEKEAKKHRPKLAQFKHRALAKYVVGQLKKDWSPEQIAGVLKRQTPPELTAETICLETIYQFIYEGEGRWLGLYQHLRRGRKKRQKRWARKTQKVLIPERISIHLRPEEINEKVSVGHWESDTVEGKRTTKGNLSVQYERKLMLARLHKVPNKTADETEQAIRRSIDSLPEYFFKTITFDNGGEAATHLNLQKDFDLQTFFCDTYSSWQKGGVENLNGLIRQYLPKRTDISQLSHWQIYEIQERLNNRPRKTLNYLTPNQVLACEVGK